MVVIPKSAKGTKSVFRRTDEDGSVVIRGPGKTQYVCGKCDAIILEGIGPHQVQDIIFECNSCGSYNDMPS
jgi:DNA-directed RNA polymerase subunit RPC12/RpoP